MGKHAHKRQKTGKESPIPLGSNALTDEASKDDEERRLESLLFGTKFVSRNEVDEQDQVDGGKELQNLIDTDVRFSFGVVHYIDLYYSYSSSTTAYP